MFFKLFKIIAIMAILNGGILGEVRGKVGNVVTGSDIKGQTTVRSYQPNVANPRTTEQVKGRVILVGSSKLTGSFLAATGGKTFKTIPANYPNARSYMVATMRKNTTDTVTAANGVGFADTDQVPDKTAFQTMPIRWASGQMSNGNIQCTSVNETTQLDIQMQFTWTPANIGGYDEATDKLTVLFIDTETGGVKVNELTNARSTAVADVELTFPLSMNGHFVVVTAFFRKELGANKYVNTSPAFTLLTGIAEDGVTLDIQNLLGSNEIFG